MNEYTMRMCVKAIFNQRELTNTQLNELNRWIFELNEI